MMPSGNDVAFAISQFFGYKLFQKKYCSADKEKKMSLYFDNHEIFVKYFIAEMNSYSKKLGL